MKKLFGAAAATAGIFGLGNLALNSNPKVTLAPGLQAINSSSSFNFDNVRLIDAAKGVEAIEKQISNVTTPMHRLKGSGSVVYYNQPETITSQTGIANFPSTKLTANDGSISLMSHHLNATGKPLQYTLKFSDPVSMRFGVSIVPSPDAAGRNAALSAMQSPLKTYSGELTFTVPDNHTISIAGLSDSPINSTISAGFDMANPQNMYKDGRVVISPNKAYTSHIVTPNDAKPLANIEPTRMVLGRESGVIRSLAEGGYATLTDLQLTNPTNKPYQYSIALGKLYGGGDPGELPAAILDGQPMKSWSQKVTVNPGETKVLRHYMHGGVDTDRWIGYQANHAEAPYNALNPLERRVLNNDIQNSIPPVGEIKLARTHFRKVAGHFYYPQIEAVESRLFSAFGEGVGVGAGAGAGIFGIGFGLGRRRRKPNTKVTEHTVPAPTNEIIPETKVENVVQQQQPAPVQRAGKIRDEEAYQRRQAQIAADQHKAEQAAARRARAKAAHDSVGRGHQQANNQPDLQRRLAAYKQNKYQKNIEDLVSNGGEITVYRGVGKNRNPDPLAHRDTLFYTTNPKWASEFGEVHSTTLNLRKVFDARSPEAKALSKEFLEWRRVNNIGIFDPGEGWDVAAGGHNMARFLKEKGYDGYLAYHMDGITVGYLNPVEEKVNRVSVPREKIAGQQKILRREVLARRDAARQSRRAIQAISNQKNKTQTSSPEMTMYNGKEIPLEVFKNSQRKAQTKRSRWRKGWLNQQAQRLGISYDEAEERFGAGVPRAPNLEYDDPLVIASRNRKRNLEQLRNNAPDPLEEKGIIMSGEMPLHHRQEMRRRWAVREAKRAAELAEQQAQAEAAEAARQAAKAAQQAANEAAQTVAEAKGAQQALAQADTPVAGKAAVEAAKDAIKGLGNLEKGALSKAGLAGAGAAGAFAIWALARNERKSQISPRRRDANVQVAPESFDTTNRRSIAMGAMAAGAALAGAPIKGISPQQRALLGIGGALGLAVGAGKATGQDTSSVVLGTAITGSIAAIAYSLLSKNGAKGVGVLRNFLTKHGPKAQLDAAALASQKAQNDIGGLTKYLSAQNIAIAGGLLTLPAAHSLMVKHFAAEKRRTTDHSDVAFLPAWQDNKAGSTKWRKSNDPLFVGNPSNNASVNFNGAIYSHYNSSSIFENF